MIYIAATVTAVLFVWLSIRSNTSLQKKAFAVIAALPLFILSAVRWDVGTDTWHTYTPEYLAMKSESKALSDEEQQIITYDFLLIAKRHLGYPDEQVSSITTEDALSFFRSTYSHTSAGFQTMERGLVALDADVQWLYVITSLIIITFVFASIYMQSNEPALALLFFVITSNYFLSLNIVSQYMAISICLFACWFAEKRKPLPFFLLIILASSFHLSALVFLPVYFLPKLKVKAIWCFAAIAAALLLGPIVFPLLEKFVVTFTPKYARYFGENTDFEWIFFALGITVLAVSTYYWKEGSDKPFYRLWYYANVLGMIALCFSAYVPYMKRINYYFAAPHFLLLPLVITCEADPKRRKILKAAIILLFIAETVVAVGMLNKNEVLPYQAFFSGNSRIGLTELALGFTD